MKNYTRIISAFYFQPWNILPEKHVAMGMILQQHLKAANFPQPRPMRSDVPGVDKPVVGPVYADDGEPVIEQMQTGGGLAIIPVHGVLGRHLDSLDLMCGGCDYDHVSQMTELANEDPSIHTIIYDFNTPGGQAVGNPECAMDIAASPKRTLAYFDQQCASAGYFLAAQCDEIHAAPSAITASIGSYMAAIDNSREWEMLGWKLQLFRSGNLKAAGEDGKAWTPEELKHFQGLAMFAGNTFKNAVLAKRPQIAADTMEGQWMFAEQGLSLGLIDGLANKLQDVVTAALAA